MSPDPTPSLYQRLKTLLIGGARNPFDKQIFHNLSLIAFFAWVGLGADGLSSSCYGPEEAFKALTFTAADGSVTHFPYLGIFVALAAAGTVLIISASYSQIIELFPSGGGGYLVASKLLSPSAGMVSGCALVMDYVLTITISVASGADYVFSFLPPHWHGAKLPFAVLALLGLTLLNLRGVKESVAPLVPIFLVFVLTYAIIIGTTLITKVTALPQVAQHTVTDLKQATSSAGFFGMLLIMLRAFAMGAGTFTGIEAVSNGMPILREPRVATGKRTMRYMAASLAIAVVGLMLAYLLYEVKPDPGQTLNSVLVKTFTAGWPQPWGMTFVFLTLMSSTALLFVAAQAGFLGGPRVLVNMALDRWFPHKFATFSDRLVTQNGVLLMAAAALGAMLLTRGSVKLLVVLYSINVFITFTLSQTAMVKHWAIERSAGRVWLKGMLINGVGLVICAFILVMITAFKFLEGAWVTLLVTGGLIVVVILIREHYVHTRKLLQRLDGLVRAAEMEPQSVPPPDAPDRAAKTAVLMVNGFNGLGLHTMLNILRLFPGVFRNFVFVQVGVLDAGNFKGVEEIDNLKNFIATDVQRYVAFVNKQGFFAESYNSVGTDIVDEVANLAPTILEKYPDAVFFGGQLVFPQETLFTRLLHNYTVFALQRRFYSQGIPVVILPIRV
ncbi:MAG: APC family permease [Phycisphaeraceae bacterium]